MADLSMKSTKKKRKLSSPEEKQRPQKTHRIKELKEIPEAESSKGKEFEETIEVVGPWRNLQLILSLQSKEIDLQKKVQIAFDYVNSRAKGGNDIDDDCETVKVSRLIVFLNDWVQSLLISTDKKIKADGEQPGPGVVKACLDYRCWVIFKFCLEESLRMRVSLSFSRNLLQAVCCVARHALSLLADMPLGSKESVFIGEGFELYGVVLDCVSLVFLSHGGLTNENLDLWISTVRAVLELVHKIYDENLECANVGVFALRFSCLVLEPFAKFLRVHPTRKNGFHDFVDKLLELLLHLLGVLRLHLDGSNRSSTGNLLIMVEEVFSQGLFHPTHIDGFLSLRSADKYSTSNDGNMKNADMVIKSYHRHLFDKLERIVATKKESALSGLGDLFHLLVDRVKKQKAASMLSEDTKTVGQTRGTRSSSDRLSTMLYLSNSAPPQNSYGPGNLNADKRKLLFDFFVQIMEPLLLEMNGYLQTKLEVGPLLMDAYCTVKSINSLLARFLGEKLYIKTEDISEGACLNFLKKIYNIVLSSSTNLFCFPMYDIDNRTQEILILLARELLVAMEYLLDIEYEVIENDLISLWLIMLCYLAISHLFKDAPDQCLLISQILRLGCQLVKLYGELRQVKNAVFALCKAIRLIAVRENDSGELKYGKFWSCTFSLPYEAHARAVGMLLCMQEFKLAIHNGLKSIPEGQACECIRQLGIDLTESIEWMKTSCSVDDGKQYGESNARSRSILSSDLQAELFGSGLSEMYTLVLDSLTVTIGNSSLVGRSVKDLMTIICPCMRILVGLQPDSVTEFLSLVTGRTSDKRPSGKKYDMLKLRVSTHWVFVFFFRFYMSCRSLYRQAISLMPPDLSRKMSAVMADSFTAHSGRDWLERTDWENEGYFSWIVQPSASLLVIIQSVSDIYLQGSIADCYPLIYVLHAMALQRLVDLNRQIKSLEYILQRNNNASQIMLHDDTGISLHHKRSRKWERCISVMKQEASGLTEFMMSYLILLGNNQVSVYPSDDAISLDTCDQAPFETDNWALDVCTVNKKSLPTAIWWIICQNIDVWSIHASKKKLKMFLSHLICTSLPCIARSSTEVGKHHAIEADVLNKMNVHQISSELLHDSILYEHKFVRRHFASRFCHLLEKSVLPLFSNLSIGAVNLNSPPNWQEFLSAFEKSTVVGSGSKPAKHNRFSGGRLISHLSVEMPADISRPSTAMKFRACQNLLCLLCWIPKGHMNARSFSLYVTYVLNLERLVIGSLIDCQDALSSHKQHEILQLLLSCRRALKYITMAYCEEKTGSSQSSPLPILSEGSFCVLWLFKSMSVVVGLQETISKDCADEVRDIIFSLMDHTSYMILTLSKYQCTYAIHSMISWKDPKEQPGSNVAQEHQAWKNVLLVAESLKEQTQGLHISLKDDLCNEKVEDGVSVVNLNRLSSIVCCFSGFLWGLGSALIDTNATDNDNKVNLLRWECEPISKINLCINVLADFISFALHTFFVEDGYQLRNLCDARSFQRSDDSSGLMRSGKFSRKGCANVDILCGEQHKNSEAAAPCSASSDSGDDSKDASVHGHSLHANSIASVLNKLDLFECQSLNKYLLHNLLKGNHPEAAILVRQLLIASAAITRLNLWTRFTPLLSSLVPSFIALSEVLLLKLADRAEVPQQFSFAWLDGVLKYLQELGGHFPLTSPTLTRTMYAKLIELLLKALGKCISLQGKKATLAFHETESNAKTIHSHVGSSKVSLSHGPYCLDEFKARLRMSFKELIRKPSELHMLSAIEVVERALVGVHEVCPMIYEINTGSADGGNVSPTVAAAIECLDLILEYVSGRKRLSVVKKHIQSFIAALFSIILHLQNSLIFYSTSTGSKGDTGPDPGAVILMCVEVLTRVSGKYALFQMDSWHVAQSLRIPAALFQDFGQAQFSEGPASSCSSSFSGEQDCHPVAAMSCPVLDEQFTTELFVACCRLLYTTLKHHKSESERCIALLLESARTLLHCLEMVDTDLAARKAHFLWGVQEGVKCACVFRRIYEELRQQKDVFGRHCFKFLSEYIWVYSGYGPLKIGIKREIDEALGPGVYALIDACSADDLQYLHSMFGEGPCRNTMVTLQHKYKLNFQYEGKV